MKRMINRMMVWALLLTMAHTALGQNVGIGTTAPTAKLHVAGNQKIDSTYTLELGAGLTGKEPNAGKIGYQVFSTTGWGPVLHKTAVR
jgi:hypothetical protein